MLQRPKVGETEEDLLQQEEEFLRQSGKEPSQRRDPEVNPDEEKSSAAAEAVREVVERNEELPSSGNGSDPKGTGFPNLFVIDPEATSDTEGKKSLFVLHVEKNKETSDNGTMDLDAPGSSTGAGGADAGSGVSQEDTASGTDAPNVAGSKENSEVSNEEKKSIEAENVNKLSAMTEAEILEIQKKLQETLDPKLIFMLQNRGKEKGKENGKKVKDRRPREVGMPGSSKVHEDKVKETLRSYVGNEWVNMDFIEKEKLEWVGDIPNSDSLEPDKPYSARFNFKGELQPFKTEIDVTSALYHHGDEPDRPGYTIQELYQLARSTVLQQRILALNTLGNIIHKSKLGYYDVCFDGFLLHKLVEADLFLLLRFSIDEKALAPAAIKCLRRLLHNDSDEYCLDRVMGITEEDLQPFLSDKSDLKKEDERELTDEKLIRLDMVKGVLRTDLLTRLTYIVNHLPCERETITNALLCFIRVARHSAEACERLARVPGLLHFAYSSMTGAEPLPYGAKLFRVLIGQSREVAVQIASRYPLAFIVDYLDRDSMSGVSKGEFFLLKLECVYLWKSFVRCGFMKDDFACWTPHFVRTLRFFVEKADLTSEFDFDFEFFTALMSVLRLCVRQRLPLDNHYPPMMFTCLEKWMSQLLRGEKFSYGALKALGSCFAFFIDYFEIFGCEGPSVNYIRKIKGIVATYMASSCFGRMASNLFKYSHILVASEVNRDPPNLPSLCSVYENGDDFVRIVNGQSTLPFFIYFVKYLQFSYDVLKEPKTNLELFIRNPSVEKYTSKILNLGRNTGNWFERYELSFLTDLLQLHCTIGSGLGLKLGFRLLPMIRIDEEDLVFVMSLMTDKKNWGSNDAFFDYLSEIYLDVLYNPEMRNGYALRYRKEPAGEDWLYKVLTRFRGKDAVTEVLKALKFMSHITQRQPDLLERVSFTSRYYHLCSVFLTDSNVFNDGIKNEMRSNFRCILENRDKIDLTQKVEKNKSFYDFYMELITQYAAVSYGMQAFAEYVLFPLQNKFDVSYRKLIWFEYLHVLRVITLPYPSPRFMDVREFIEPFETDESLLVAYLNSISSHVISKKKNPFVYNLAVANINNYMTNASPDSTLYKFLSRRIRFTIGEKIKQDLTSW